MVATVVPVTNASSLMGYFMDESRVDAREHRRASRWHGAIARELGLGRLVGADLFERLLEGHVPGTDVRLGRIRHGEHQHRPGVHVTFSAPKSVSVDALVYGNKKTERAHERATAVALDYLETRLLFTLEVDPLSRRRIPAPAHGAVLATFRHLSSRAGDPQLHVHCIVMNITRDSSGAWRSLHFAGLHAARHLLGAIYRHALAAGLRKAGLALVPAMAGAVPSFEIRGYGPELLASHSRRRRDILAYVRDRGWDYNASTAQQATLMTRGSKLALCRAEHEERWAAIARECGGMRDEAATRSPRRRASPGPTAPVRSPMEHIVQAAARLEERTTVFRAQDLLAMAIAQSCGTHRVDDFEAAIDQLERDGYLIGARRRHVADAYMTERAVRAQRELTELSRRGRGPAHRLADQSHTALALVVSKRPITLAQHLALREILFGTDRTVGILDRAAGRGPIMDVLRLCGERDVLGLAQSMSAARVLATEVPGIHVKTVGAFLRRYRDVADDALPGDALEALRAKFRGIVVIVDGAAAVSTAQVRDLLRIAERLAVARVVMVAEPRDLRVAAAGQPFRQLQEADMPTAVVDDQGREGDPSLKETVLQALGGEPARVLRVEGTNVVVVAVAVADLAQTAMRVWASLPRARRHLTAFVAQPLTLRQRLARAIPEDFDDDDGLSIDTLVDLGLGRAERRKASNYRRGDVALFERPFPRQSIATGDVHQVVAVEGDFVTVGEPGAHYRFRASGRLADGVRLFETATVHVRAGDRIRWTRDDAARSLRAGTEATILEIGKHTLLLDTQDGRRVTLRHGDPHLRHIAPVRISISQSTEGADAHTFIALHDSRDATPTGERNLCLEIARMQSRVLVLTDDEQALADALARHMGARLEPDPEATFDPPAAIGARVQALMRRPVSSLTKATPRNPIRMAFDAWCVDRDRHDAAAIEAGVHPSRYPGHGALSARLLSLTQATDVPDVLRNLVALEYARHEELAGVADRLARNASHIDQLRDLGPELEVPDGEPDSREDGHLDGRYESWRDAVEQAVADGNELLGREDLHVAVLAQECDAVRAAIQKVREPLVEHDRRIAAWTASQPAAAWLAQWDARYERDGLGLSPDADPTADPVLLNYARHLLEETALSSAWREVVATRLDERVAVAAHANLVHDIDLMKHASAAEDIAFQAHADAPALVERARRLAMNPALPPSSADALREHARDHVRWHAEEKARLQALAEAQVARQAVQRASAAFEALELRRKEIERDSAAQRRDVHEHDEMQRFVADVTGLLDDAQLPPELGKTLEGWIKEDRNARATMAEASSRLVTLREREQQLRLATADERSFHAHADTAGLMDDMRKLIETGGLPRAREDALRSTVDAYDTWRAEEAARIASAALDKDIRQVKRDAAMRDLTVHEPHRASELASRASAAEKEFAAWALEMAPVDRHATAAGIPFHAHEDGPRLLQQAVALSANRALGHARRTTLPRWLAPRTAALIVASLETALEESSRTTPEDRTAIDRELAAVAAPVGPAPGREYRSAGLTHVGRHAETRVEETQSRVAALLQEAEKVVTRYLNDDERTALRAAHGRGRSAVRTGRRFAAWLRLWRDHIDTAAAENRHPFRSGGHATVLPNAEALKNAKYLPAPARYFLNRLSAAYRAHRTAYELSSKLRRTPHRTPRP